MATFFQTTNPKRQSLVRPLQRPPQPRPSLESAELEARAPEAGVADFIKTRAALQAALVNAFKLELATVPPYMCGLYSIRDGTNAESAKLIRSVLVEEMLHMVLVANLLNAISTPDEVSNLLSVKAVMADYPAVLPGNIRPTEPKDFRVELLPFSAKALDEFLAIERPADPNARLPDPAEFGSIGQFYQAIRFGFDRLKGIFGGEHNPQITDEHYYGSGGKIVAVHSLEDAAIAIEEIVGQGEGIDGTIRDPDSTLFGVGVEYAHYFKFQEIRCGRFYQENDTNQQAPTKSIPTGLSFDVSYSSAHAMRANPKVAHYRDDPDLARMAIEFNTLYTGLIATIIASVGGHPAEIRGAILVMHELRARAKALMNIRLQDGSYAGPTFEYTA